MKNIFFPDSPEAFRNMFVCPMASYFIRTIADITIRVDKGALTTSATFFHDVSSNDGCNLMAVFETAKFVFGR